MSNRKKAKSPLRSALAKKTTLRTYFDIALVDTDEYERLQRKLAAAQQLAGGALVSDNPNVKKRAETVLAEVQAEYAEGVHRIWFRPLADDEWDALVDLHPPTPEQRKDGHGWNPDTFDCGLLAACTVDSDLTEDDWREELADTEKWPKPDRAGLVLAAVRAQRQSRAVEAGKG